MKRAHSAVIAILGDGGWGTALALHLSHRGHQVRWWGPFPAYLAQMARTRTNPKYLPGIRIPRAIRIVPNLAEAIGPAQTVVVVIPSQYLRSIVTKLAPLPLTGKSVLNAGKGLELSTLARQSQVIQDELGRVPLAVLSGPNIAGEIAQGQPASAVIASRSPRLASSLQRLFNDERLRIYTSSDVIGVELGGALKNSIAIAAGVADGLGFGANAKSALLSRGIVEMARLGVAMGAKRDTFWGLSGLGDLITTCLGGRNRWLGEQLGKGRSLAQIQAATPSVIEGVNTAKAAGVLSRQHHVELPIIEQVHAVLSNRTTPRAALHALMTRTPKTELR